MTVEEFLAKFDRVEQRSGEWEVPCPAHDDNNPSLGVREGAGGEILINCHAGCPNEAVVAAMGLTFADLFPNSKSWGEPEAIYPYRDGGGNVLFEAVRFPGKKFKQRHLVDGEYVYSLEGIRRVIFRLPEIIDAVAKGETIYLCEGEKDVISMVKAGAQATCNPMGAMKWRDEFCQYLAVASNVVIIADKDGDGTGLRHAEKVRDSLRQNGQSMVSIVEAKEGKDATDHLDAGYSISEFVPVIERVRRGIVTAREMAHNGVIHATAIEGTIEEYVVPSISLGRNPLTFRPGRPYSIGAYTGDGKTTFAMQVSRELLSQPHPPRIGYFSNEMSSDDLRNRFIEHWGLPLDVIEHPWRMAEPQKRTYTAAVAQMKDWPLEVIFDTEASAEMICSTTRDREYEFVIVDHIHRVPTGGDRGKLENEIRMLTNLALDFNIPVFVLAQFRATRSGQGKFETYPKPTLATFKETSKLGEEAALSLGLWRHRMGEGSEYDPHNYTSLIVLKNRYGPTAEATIQLDTQRMLFVPGGSHESIVGSQGAAEAGGGSDEY